MSCVVMSAKVLVMCFGSVQYYSSSRADFLMIELQEKLRNKFKGFDALDSLGKSSFILGSELWENHCDLLLVLVKEYVVNVQETQKLKLYGDGSSQSQSSTRDLGILLGLKGLVVCVCVMEVSLKLAVVCYVYECKLLCL